MIRYCSFRIALFAVPLLAAGVFTVWGQVSVLTKPAIPVVPLLYDGQVCIQDYSQNSYRLKTVSLTGTTTELRNNMAVYLWPFTWGGTHAAWIGYDRGFGGSGGGGIGGGSATYYVQTIAAANKAERTIVEKIYYIEQVTAAANRIVWTDYRYFSATDTTIEIFLYDFGSSSERRITSQRGYKAAPSILGNRIVWQDYRNAASNRQNADIYLYDLAASQERSVCTHNAYQDQPDVYNDLVVWQDYRNTGSDSKNADIYLRDMTATAERAICAAPGYQAYPRVYGQFVVWQDYRNVSPQDTGNADIYMFDLSSNTERAVVTRPGYQAEPYLYGSTVVWYDYTDNAVYKAELTANEIQPEKVTQFNRVAAQPRLSHRLNAVRAPASGNAGDLLGRSRSGSGVVQGAGAFIEP